MDAEQSAIQTGRGLWASSEVPKSGWRCVGIADLGAPAKVCDMCLSMHIRYAHTMFHPATGRTLVAGCVCAGHMQGNLGEAQGNDSWLRNRAARRLRWSHRRWRTSRSGNPCTTSEGMTLTVFKQDGKWKAVVSDTTNRDIRLFTDRAYPGLEDAKMAAFDLCTQHLAQHRVQSGHLSASPARRSVTASSRKQPATAVQPSLWVRVREVASKVFRA